jgi:rhamnose utilization protein RhaD (predicted bifunctional aldolase and dehydrogenase)
LSSTTKSEITALLEVSARIGQNPLLTQASTGNTSVKLDGVMWIKASGAWLAHAKQHQILMPIDLAEARDGLQRHIDPAKKYNGAGPGQPRASIETALHVVLPHKVVMHVHSVNTIAWAVREDALERLTQRLEGLHWQWVPYVPSGLPLAQEIERRLSEAPGTNVFVLGNHGLVVAAGDCDAAENFLWEVERRVAITPRRAVEADYATLARMANGAPWDLSSNVTMHALGTDSVSARILAGGLLYPCQAIFANCSTPELFCPVRPEPAERCEGRYDQRPFLIVEGCGILVSKSLNVAESAILSGLAQVVRRISSDAPIRYLTAHEITNGLNVDAYQYRELANRQSGQLAV